MAAEIQVRTGQAPPALTREAFGERFRVQFYEPRCEDERDAIRRLEEIAWRNYPDGRKAPRTVAGGPGVAIPEVQSALGWPAALGVQAVNSGPEGVDVVAIHGRVPR